MPTITVADAAAIEARREALAHTLAEALAATGDAVQAEIAAFAEARARDPQRWAQLVTIKAILSPGTRLDRNIALARALTDALRAGAEMTRYEDVEPLRRAPNYTSRSVGVNINAALGAWPRIAEATPEAIMALVADGALPNMGRKVASWARALYDATSPVVALDQHMCRGLAALADLERDGITRAAYTALEPSLLTSLAASAASCPLHGQWALWNAFRHPGEHASHLALIAPEGDRP